MSYDIDIWTSVVNTSIQDKAFMPLMKNIDEDQTWKGYTLIDNIYADNKTILQYMHKDNLINDSLYTQHIIYHPFVLNRQVSIDINKLTNEAGTLIFPAGTYEYRLYGYWINEFGIILDDINELDKLSITIIIGGWIVTRIENLLVDNIISSHIKYNNEKMHIPLSYLLCNHDYPLPNIGLFFHDMHIDIKYHGNVLLDKQINFYIDYLSLKDEISLTYDTYKPLQQLQPKDSSPILGSDRIIHQEQIMTQLLNVFNNNVYLMFNHPTHILYIYFSDYRDYMENYELRFNNNIVQDITITKTNNDTFNSMYAEMFNAKRNYEEALMDLPILVDICKYIILPYLYKDISVEPLLNKTIYKIEFDPTIDQFAFVMPKMYINLSRIDTVHFFFTHNYNNPDKQISVNVLALNKNMIVMKEGITGIHYAN